MPLISRKNLLITLLFLNSLSAVAQYGQMPPFTIELEAINGTTIPGLHSFAFAQSGDKWLFIGGRTNGLHGINSSGAFPPEYKNNSVFVIDTLTWQYYQANLNQLPKTIADPMRSTNMESIQDGNYLYMIGGYGYDSVANMFVTFPKLTAIHVDNMINAVMNAQPIAPCIRQIADTNLSICGGDLGKIGNDFYLMFGHNFGGRYSDPPTPLFTQTYSECIKKFNISDDGTNITLSNFTYQVDSTNFHRRDLSTCGIVKPNGSLAIGAYGGVFRKDANLPFREPITISANGATVNNTYQQVMSQYSCGIIPVYDSVTQNMYTTFLGGISMYDYNIATQLVVYDSLMPFINDITTLTAHSNGSVEETVLPTQLPGLIGSNSKFIFNQNIPSYSNEVIKLRKLTHTKTLVGYLFGGIRAQQGNFGSSAANDTIYKVYLTPTLPNNIKEETSIQNVILFPNPSSQNPSLLFNLKNTEKIKIILSDITGKEIQLIIDEEMQKGNKKIAINTSMLSVGMYICRLESSNYRQCLKLIVNK
ncbi:MAG: T9SS type A sorting domain-containing protein [Bacteroidetes bacterium]|nr:T9SS type A sorting domain-containing protein [Bacteroidota bacterium]